MRSKLRPISDRVRLPLQLRIWLRLAGHYDIQPNLRMPLHIVSPFPPPAGSTSHSAPNPQPFACPSESALADTHHELQEEDDESIVQPQVRLWIRRSVW